MNFKPNNLYYWMVDKYISNKTNENKIVICNEGSSRSSKTWDAFHLIYTFCDHNRYLDIPLEIGVFRRTLKDCREKTYEKDFKGCAKTIGFYNKEDARKENTSPDYYLFGNKIEFRGLDDGSEATAYDIVFINESLEVESELLISGLKMRCRKLMLFDWNPKYTLHWVFEYEGRPFTYFSKTTYKNNVHLEQSVITEIESKSPWDLKDLHLPENERRPHKQNLIDGTIDEWYFKVYGMGERANKTGLVFPNVTWIDKFPEDVEQIGYGFDIGYTHDPSALTKVGINGDNIYIELLMYQPTENASIAAPLIKAVAPELDYLVCDSADPQFIIDLNLQQITTVAVKKFAGSIKYGIGLLKSYKIHLVKNTDVQKEQENYAWRQINGISLDEPVDGFNHFWDSARYVTMFRFRKMQ